MPWTREHMDNAEWSIGLVPETPRSVLDEANIIDNAFATIIVTPVEVDPDDFTVAELYDLARFTGRFMEVSDGGLTLGGDGLLGWLGDENDGGNLIVGATTTSSAFDLEAQLDARIFTSRSNGLTKGTVNNNSQTRAISIEPGTTPRQFLDTICALYSNSNHNWEYRVNTDGSVDVDRAGGLWPTAANPTTMLSRSGGFARVAGTYKYLLLDGVGDYASCPDVATFPTGDITIFAKVRLDDYSTGAVQTIFSKWDAGTNNRSIRMEFTGAGEIQVFWSTNGTATTSDVTGSVPPLNNGSDYWVGITIDVVQGANKEVVYYYASGDDYDNWRDVPLWAVADSNVTAGTTSIFNSNAVCRAGGIVGDTLMPTGRIYSVEVMDGLWESGGAETACLNPHFETWPIGDTSEPDTAATPNTWTLSGNAFINSSPGSSITGLPAEMERADLDVYDYRTAVYAGDPDTAIIGNASQTPPTAWVDFAGATPVLRSLIHSTPRHRFVDRVRRWSARVGAARYAAWTLTSAGQATNMATAALAKTDTYDFSVTADVDCFDVGRYVDCGDTVYVWEQRQRLSDNTNEVYYRGEAAHPKKLRVRRMTVPIQQGNGVYLAFFSGSKTVLDLTKYVEFEDGPARLELGTKAFLHRPNARPHRINRRRMARLARQRYLLARWLGGSPD